MAQLDADTTSNQQFESLTAYFGIELDWHRVGGIEAYPTPPNRHPTCAGPQKICLRFKKDLSKVHCMLGANVAGNNLQMWVNTESNHG